MKITEFAKLVTQNEGLKEQVNIAQTMEILKIVNRLLFGIPYKIIKLL